MDLSRYPVLDPLVRWYHRTRCLFGRHRYKFDTYPRRGLCIHCGHDWRQEGER